MTDQSSIATPKTGVHVIIQDTDGTIVAEFAGQDNKSFVQMAADHDVELPSSCCSGACFVCACKVKEGLDAIDIGKISIPLVDIEDDQVLSCVGGIKSQYFNDGNYYQIVLEKLL